MTKISLPVPQQVSRVTNTLQDNGYEAYLVGGCVRDMLLNRVPQDWDVTTNAKPEEIQECFDHTFYENDFGTVGIVNDDLVEKIKELELEIDSTEDKDSRETLEAQIDKLKKIKTVEVTPYRTESQYSDNRRPDNIKFSQKLEDDLMRRDFTINAICYNPSTEEIIDLHGGINDLNNKLISTVGSPNERMSEDALRLMRAVRFATQLDFSISRETKESTIELSKTLSNVSRERIRDEFNKILMSDKPMDGILLLDECRLLQIVCPKLVLSQGVDQNGSHVFDVYEHLLRTLQHASDKNWGLEIRLAALFHDISKPETRRWSKEKNDYTFYGHEVVGSRETKKILKNFGYSNEIVEKVTLLVRWHMFFSDPDEISLSAVRRIIRNVHGDKNVWELIKLRICDRIGMGRPKERPYRLRKYEAMMDEAMRSPISVKDLKINGDQIIQEFHMKPGRRMGWILHALMRETLHTPENNNYDWLVKHVSQLDKLTDSELERLYLQGKEAIDEAEEAELAQIRKKRKIGKK